MDASNEPEKANNPAVPAQGSASERADGLPNVDSPPLVPGHGEPANDRTAPEVPPVAGTALVLAPADQRREQAQERPRAAPWRLTKLSSLAASLALAVGVGALAGAIGMIGLQRAFVTEPTPNPKVQEAIVRLSSEFAAFRASVEAANKAATGQMTRLNDRLDRAERAQVEPAAKLARISEAVERLEKRASALPAASPVTVARSSDVTGSIPTPPPAPAAKDLSRLPVIPGMVLYGVEGGAALVQSRLGLMELEVGDPLPGGGRVEAIRRDNGRWVVVTTRGLIVAR